MSDRTCRGCGTILTVKAYRRMGQRRFYCLECEPIGQLARRSDTDPTKPRVTCIRCGQKLLGKRRKYCSTDCHHIYAGVKRKEPYEDRICKSCGESFRPRSHNQYFCPAKDGTRRSPCANRYERHMSRHGCPPPIAPQPGQPFDCASCGKHCIPRTNVAPHATKFCSQLCNTRWHKAVKAGKDPRVYKPLGPTCRIPTLQVVKPPFIEGHCLECEARFVSRDRIGRVGYCCESCRRRASKRRRRARLTSARVEVVSFRKVAERDSFCCGICGDPVAMDADVPEDFAPTLDHIVPLARGGEHSLDNCQLAHFICNSTKSDKLLA